jgi:tetratricopeptide (TPR) repeat protein
MDENARPRVGSMWRGVRYGAPRKEEAMLCLSHPRFALAGAALAALLAGVPARADPPANHDEALAEMQDPDAANRTEAIVWLANHGTMADAPRLQERLRDESPFVRALAERGLWRLWSRSGDEEIDRLVARGAEQMESGALEDAIASFSEVIRRRPEFAEGWNKRATARFLAGKYRESIADCAEVLKRNPGHFGALSGLGQIYLRLEEPEHALAWFRKALEINPNLSGVESQIEEIEERIRDRRARVI